MNSLPVKIWMACALLAVAACSGGVSSGGPAPTGTLEGGSGQGGDAASGSGSSSFAGGPLDASRTAAQPLGGGFPAPSLEGDPGEHVYSVNFMDRAAECREEAAGVYEFRLEGYVMPPVSYQSIAGHVLRLVDPQAKTYVDTELMEKGEAPKEGPRLLLNYSGYFFQRVSMAYPMNLKAYLLPPVLGKDSLGKALPCASEACVPEGAYPVKGDFMDGFDASHLPGLASCFAVRGLRDSAAPALNLRR